MPSRLSNHLPQVAEHAAPAELLRNAEGLFSQLVDSTGESSATELRARAEVAWSQRAEARAAAVGRLGPGGAGDQLKEKEAQPVKGRKEAIGRYLQKQRTRQAGAAAVPAL